MTHPQVLAQCKSTLRAKYSRLAQTSGKGIMVDHANVALALGARRLPKSIAVMGNRVLAGLYGLQIVAENLQDAKKTLPVFFM